MHTTSVTLLEKLRSATNQDAWYRFVDLYTPYLYHLARQRGLQRSDAADLVQDVLTLLLQKLPHFQYQQGGSFRGWLQAVTSNLWKDRLRAVATRAMPGAEGLSSAQDQSNALEFENREYREYLVSRALQLMKADFEATTWQAAWALCVECRAADEIAQSLGITVSAVYCAKYRVINRLRNELRGLLDD